MARNTGDDRELRHRPGRPAHGSTDRRTFLNGAGKYSAALMGAAFLAGGAAAQDRRDEQDPLPSIPDGPEIPVLETGMVRLLGVVQRRPGLTKKQAKFRSPAFDLSDADRVFIASGTTDPNISTRRPTSIGSYYEWVYTQLTKNQPGRRRGTYGTSNIVVDAAFGVDSANTALANRDLVTEFFYEREGQKPAVARPQPVPPASLEAGTALNLVVEQVLAQGMRPSEPTGESPKGMYFIKLSPTTTTDPVKAWQTLHASAIADNPTFGDDLLGHELLKRLAGTPGKQMTGCGGEMAVPDLVACFWSKTTGRAVAFQTAFENYVQAFQRADKGKAVDHASSFFLLIEEYGRSA